MLNVGRMRRGRLKGKRRRLVWEESRSLEPLSNKGWLWALIKSCNMWRNSTQLAGAWRTIKRRSFLAKGNMLKSWSLTFNFQEFSKNLKSSFNPALMILSFSGWYAYYEVLYGAVTTGEFTYCISSGKNIIILLLMTVEMAAFLRDNVLYKWLIFAFQSFFLSLLAYLWKLLLVCKLSYNWKKYESLCRGN